MNNPSSPRAATPDGSSLRGDLAPPDHQPNVATQSAQSPAPQPDTAHAPADQAVAPNTEAKAAEAEPKKSHPLRMLIIAVVALVAIVSGGIYWYHGTFYEETDDAQVDGYISNIAPRIGGTVLAVHVDDNEVVQAGAPIIELDPSDARVARDQARAALAQAEAQLRGEEPSVPIAETSDATLVSTTTSDVASDQAGVAEAERALAQTVAQLADAEAKDKLAQKERERAQSLLEAGAIARSEYDARVAAASSSAANVEALRDAVGAAKRRIDEQANKAKAALSRLKEAQSNAPQQLEQKRAQVDLRKASVDSAKAALAAAELNLTYTNIVAPVSGIIGKRSVNIGDRVSAGQELLALVQTDKLWVTADLRETQVRRMHPGQTATVHVDALGRDFDGEVESMAAATGSRYSVLPPENATGNYVKVVQRVPVRIHLKPGQPGLDLLRPGMSTEVKVRVK